MFSLQAIFAGPRGRPPVFHVFGLSLLIDFSRATLPGQTDFLSNLKAETAKAPCPPPFYGIGA